MGQPQLLWITLCFLFPTRVGYSGCLFSKGLVRGGLFVRGERPFFVPIFSLPGLPCILWVSPTQSWHSFLSFFPSLPQVGGTKVLTGPDQEPVVLNVLRLAEHNEGGKGQHFSEAQHVFSCSTSLAQLHAALAPAGGIILRNGSGAEGEAKNWEVFREEDMKETVRSVGLRDGCSVLILDSHDQR